MKWIPFLFLCLLFTARLAHGQTPDSVLVGGLYKPVVAVESWVYSGGVWQRNAPGVAGAVVSAQTPIKATTSGTLAAGSRGPTFVFSSDFVGTLQGSAGGVIVAGSTYSPPTPPGTSHGAIAYTITAGSIIIFDVR